MKRFDCPSKPYLIAEVKSSMSDGLKSESELIEKIFEIRNETVEEIFDDINQKNARSIITVIKHALLIRPNKTEPLLTLLCLLLKRYSYTMSFNEYIDALLDFKGIKKWNTQGNPKDLVDIFSAGSIGRSIIEFNIDDFIQLTSDPSFDPKEKIKTKKYLNWRYEDPITTVCDDKEVSYAQIMALFSSKKCFRYAVSAGGYDMDGIAKYAVAGGDIEIIHILEQSGVSFDNCFETAVKFHREDVCDWLLTHYKCEEICASSAIEYHNINVFMFLILNGIGSNDIGGCLIEASSNGHLEVVKYLYEECHANVEAKNNKGYTPIIYASQNGHLDIVKYLYEECNANVEAKDNYGNTPIMFASKNGHLEVVKYLYEEYHANVEAMNDYGKTPIMFASENGQLDVVKYLYEECHANVEAENNYGVTPIIYASENGHLEVVKYLYEECHANVEAKNKDGDTPITYASINGHLEVVKYLYEECNANVEAKDDYGDTPIIYASEYGHLEVVKYLHEECHANVEAKNKNEETPIIIASEKGHLEVVKYLHEECHANVEAKDNKGSTPIMRNRINDIRYTIYDICYKGKQKYFDE
jgi:ankyrin repeat protein